MNAENEAISRFRVPSAILGLYVIPIVIRLDEYPEGSNRFTNYLIPMTTPLNMITYANCSLWAGDYKSDLPALIRVDANYYHDYAKSKT